MLRPAVSSSGTRSPVSGNTQVVAVIGDPVRHSLSPTVFNAAFDAAEMDWVYVAFPVPEGSGEQAARMVRTFDIRGMSVTMPHKEAVVPAMDELTEVAQRLNAVNCIVNTDGRLVGHNTDGAGFLESLRHHGFEPKGARCVVLGAGGAARAVILALSDADAASVAVHNRDAGRGRIAATLAGSDAAFVTEDALVDAIGAADLVINATPVGMSPGDGPALPEEALHCDLFVADLIYNPGETPLLAAAERVGARHCNGAGMLVHQAAEAFRIITGRPAPLHAMAEAMTTTLAERSEKGPQG